MKRNTLSVDSTNAIRAKKIPINSLTDPSPVNIA